MNMRTWVLVLAVVAVSATAAPVKEVDEWWKTAVFYQIYPRSFKDSDNDGSGDLKGITEKLQYLKDTGITATWLSPIFSSPMVDAGYDISSFRDINPIFGTMADFDELLKKANEIGVKIILDFVPNHSSDQHEWFEKSVNKEGKYTDYYVWEDGKVLEDGTRVPPNNWKSLFLGSAWEWNEKRQQYYLHQFAIQQPDLNYRSPALVEEMKDVLRFWLDKGVAGFRVDAVPFIFEDPRLLDEPKVDPNMPDDKIEYANLEHIYTKDQNETFDMVYQMRAVTDEYTNKDGVSRVMMTESYTTIENTMRYFGNETTDGAHFTFNFFMLTDLNKDSSAQDFENVINQWMTTMPSRYTANWVFGNHDQHRTATRQGVNRIDGINMLGMLLPGVGVTYNGEEIGMEDGYVSWEDTQDPSALNAGKEHYLEYSRDPERTPFHWDDSVNAGFNEGSKTWLPVSEKYKQTNLAAQQQAETSHYKNYQQLQALRQTDTVQKGSYHVETDNGVLILTRELKGSNSYVLLFNLNQETVTITVPENLLVKIASVGSSFSAGDRINKNKIELSAGEALLLEAPA